MRIFISHPIIDKDLAEKLKEILKSDKKIEEAYIAINKPEYDMDIPEKIIKEMKKSDYLVAIITNNTPQSASVHQEIGYAQGINLTRIPMVENGAKAGFLHESKDKIEFTRENFDEACKRALNDILEKGPKRLFSEKDEEEIKKSAHYRYDILHHIRFFLDGMFYRLKMGDDGQRAVLFSGMEPQWNKGNNLETLKKFFENNEDKLIEHFSKIDFSMHNKIRAEYELLIRELENSDRFSHEIMPEEESDLLVKLREYIRNQPVEVFDLRKYMEDWLNIRIQNSNCFEMMSSMNPHQSLQLRNHIRYTISDLEELYNILIPLLRLYIKYQNKFGDIAFKHS